MSNYKCKYCGSVYSSLPEINCRNCGANDFEFIKSKIFHIHKKPPESFSIALYKREGNHLVASDSDVELVGHNIYKLNPVGSTGMYRCGSVERGEYGLSIDGGIQPKKVWVL